MKGLIYLTLTTCKCTSVRTYCAHQNAHTYVQLLQLTLGLNLTHDPADATKLQNGLPFWCLLTQVVLEMTPLINTYLHIQTKKHDFWYA